MIITDTGAFVALINQRDEYHDISKPSITTYPVISETCHLSKRASGQEAEQLFLRGVVFESIKVFHLDTSHLARMTLLMRKYADLPMDLADASLVVLAEHFRDGRILTVDQRDFSVYRWNDTQPFQNLLLPN